MSTGMEERYQASSPMAALAAAASAAAANGGTDEEDDDNPFAHLFRPPVRAQPACHLPCKLLEPVGAGRRCTGIVTPLMAVLDGEHAVFLVCDHAGRKVNLDKWVVWPNAD